MLNYDPEQLWPIYESLPTELRDAIFAENTAKHINSICQRNNLTDDEMAETARYVGYVLLGVLKRSEFETTLREEMKLSEDQVKKVSREMNRFIFFPLKATLDNIFPDEEWSEQNQIAQQENYRIDSYRENIE